MTVATTERKQRDKYGRTVRHVAKADAPFHTLVVIVALPKAFRQAYPGQNYLVNDWQHPTYIGTVRQGEAQGKITTVATLAQARKLAQAKIAAPTIAAVEGA